MRQFSQKQCKLLASDAPRVLFLPLNAVELAVIRHSPDPHWWRRRQYRKQPRRTWRKKFSLITRVNNDTAAASGSAASIATPGISHTTGNLLAVCLAWGSTTATVNSVQDTPTNDFAACTNTLIDNGASRTEIWYAENITGNASNVVQANFSTSVTFRSINVVQYSGCATTGAFEVGQNGAETGGSGSVTSGSFSPAASGNVNVATACPEAAGTWTTDGNYTEVINDSLSRLVEERLNAPSGAQTASATINASVDVTISVASFKPAVAEGHGILLSDERNRLVA